MFPLTVEMSDLNEGVCSQCKIICFKIEKRSQSTFLISSWKEISKKIFTTVSQTAVQLTQEGHGCLDQCQLLLPEGVNRVLGRGTDCSHKSGPSWFVTAMRGWSTAGRNN